MNEGERDSVCKEAGEKKGSACEEKCASEPNPKPRPKPCTADSSIDMYNNDVGKRFMK